MDERLLWGIELLLLSAGFVAFFYFAGGLRRDRPLLASGRDRDRASPGMEGEEAMNRNPFLRPHDEVAEEGT